MTRYSYRERDYTFGQAMLKLRNSISLTQAALADLLGVSRRAVGEWEAGDTYPKAPHLQHFVELCVQQHVFEPGHEEEEIRALWKMAHQRVWLDEAWLSTLLTRPPVPPHPITQISDTAIVEVSSASTPQLSPQVERPVIPAFAKPVAFSHVDWVGALDVSHFAGREVEVVKWAAADGSQRLQLRHAGAIHCVAWSLDGTWLACGGGGREGGEVLIYETQSGELLRTLVSHPGLVYAVAWSPGGDTLISAGSDGKLRWWEVASGQCVRVQEAHHAMVETLKVSPDGRILASCGHDGALLIWDLHSGERLQTLRRDRPYERLDITGTHGLSDAQKASLCSLGAFEETAKINSVLRGEEVQE